jgi:pyridoxal phosphate enzyme (YggS family)
VSDPRITLLADRFNAVEERIRAACFRVGRKREEVTIVAVTKSVGTDIAALLPELGQTELGESRPQELWRKAGELPTSIRWHLIGHLQRNKIEKTLPLVRLIHSVDSERLLIALDAEAANRQTPVDVLLEINASGEESKHGLAPADAPPMIGAVQSLRFVQVRGLMTMAAYEEDPERTRPTFAALRLLRDGLRQEWGTATRLDHLSMGMTNDFEIAVEEGATLIRVGTALFERI